MPISAANTAEFDIYASPGYLLKSIMEAFEAKRLISNLIVATCVGYIFYVIKAKPKKKKEAAEE